MAQSYLTLCDPMEGSPPGSSVRGISQARILEWAAISFSGDLPNLRIAPMPLALAGRFFTTELPGKPHFALRGMLSPGQTEKMGLHSLSFWGAHERYVFSIGLRFQTVSSIGLRFQTARSLGYQI